MNKKQFIMCIILLLLIPLVFAQSGGDDTDGDTVIDEYDKCQNTPENEVLPLFTAHPEYMGCSCSQIIRIIGESDCRDFFCLPGRPVNIEERIYSSKKPFCPIDFCLGNVYYDHPEPELPLCVQGVPKPYSCEPQIVNNYTGCLNGTIPQFFELQQVKNNSKNEVVVPPIFDDEKKLEERSFNLIINNVDLRKAVNLGGRDQFDIRIQETLDSVDVEKQVRKTTVKIGNKDVPVTVYTIIITPKATKVLNNLLIFEEMPRGERLITSDIVSENDPLIIDTNGPILLVWKLNDVDSKTTITYQINKDVNYETNTLMIAEPANNILTVFLIPIVLIIIIGTLFYYYFKKNIESKKSIFK